MLDGGFLRNVGSNCKSTVQTSLLPDIQTTSLAVAAVTFWAWQNQLSSPCVSHRSTTSTQTRSALGYAAAPPPNAGHGCRALCVPRPKAPSPAVRLGGPRRSWGALRGSCWLLGSRGSWLAGWHTCFISTRTLMPHLPAFAQGLRGSVAIKLFLPPNRSKSLSTQFLFYQFINNIPVCFFSPIGFKLPRRK